MFTNYWVWLIAALVTLLLTGLSVAFALVVIAGWAVEIFSGRSSA